MKAKIIKFSSIEEFGPTDERCYISELWNQEEDDSVSVAIARVEPGIRTRLHYLEGVDERYLILSGKGLVEVDGLLPTEVEKGDLVIIPAGKNQRIKNLGDTDLVFYCICTPRFTLKCNHFTE